MLRIRIVILSNIHTTLFRLLALADRAKGGRNATWRCCYSRTQRSLESLLIIPQQYRYHFVCSNNEINKLNQIDLHVQELGAKHQPRPIGKHGNVRAWNKSGFGSRPKKRLFFLAGSRALSAGEPRRRRGTGGTQRRAADATKRAAKLASAVRLSGAPDKAKAPRGKPSDEATFTTAVSKTVPLQQHEPGTLTSSRAKTRSTRHSALNSPPRTVGSAPSASKHAEPGARYWE